MQRVIFVIWLTNFLFFNQTSASRKSCGSRHGHLNKGCRLNKFLQDILNARDDLSWIDQVADRIRSSDSFSSSSTLQEKINSMFFNPDKLIFKSQQNKNPENAHERFKRNSQYSTSSRLKSKINSNNENSNSRVSKSKNPLMYEENSNFDVNTQEGIENAIAKTTTTEDALEKILKSINVFPVEDDAYAMNTDDDDAKLNTRHYVNVDASAINNTSFTDEHLRFRRSLKSSSSDTESLSGELFKKLLSSNDEFYDKSQINRALQGDVAKEIVNAIFSQIETNKGLSGAIKLKFYNVNPQKTVDESLDFQKINSRPSYVSSDVTKRLSELIDQMVSEEIEKNSCASLPPDLRNFLQWLLTDENFDNQDTNNEKENKEDENPDSKDNFILNLDAWNEKAEMLKNLLNEYEGLSKKEKNKVQGIHEYLTSRFEFVKTFINVFKSNSASGKSANVEIN